MWKCENAEIGKCGNVQMWECENMRMWKCENAEICKCGNVRMWECDNAEIGMEIWTIPPYSII